MLVLGFVWFSFHELLQKFLAQMYKRGSYGLSSRLIAVKLAVKVGSLKAYGHNFAH